MKALVFYGKRVSARPDVRTPPEDSEDSCLSDSAGSGEEYVPKPGDDESSSEVDRSSSDEEYVPKPGESGFKISTSTSQILVNVDVGW